MDYATIEQYASMPFSVAEIEAICELDAGTIEVDQKAMDAVQRGRLKARASIYSALMQEVRESGSVQAAKEMARQFETLGGTGQDADGVLNI